MKLQDIWNKLYLNIEIVYIELLQETSEITTIEIALFYLVYCKHIPGFIGEGVCVVHLFSFQCCGFCLTCLHSLSCARCCMFLLIFFNFPFGFLLPLLSIVFSVLCAEQFVGAKALNTTTDRYINNRYSLIDWIKLCNHTYTIISVIPLSTNISSSAKNSSTTICIQESYLGLIGKQHITPITR